MRGGTRHDTTSVLPAYNTHCSGFTAPSTTTGWGLISFDWSNAKEIWAKVKPMDCEELLLAQANLTRLAAPNTRVFVYR